MLVIKSKSDLLEYYQARLNMARGQERTHRKKQGHIASGLIYAWEEAIKALEALIEFEKLPTEIQQAQSKFLVSSAQALRETSEKLPES